MRAAAVAAAAAGAAADFPLRGDPTPPLPAMKCGYAVNQEPAEVLSGAVPGWLNGSYYHSVFNTKLDATIPVPGLSGVNSQIGGVLGVNFRAGGNATASFGFVRGSFYGDACPLQGKGQGPLGWFGPSGAVTVNGMGGPGTVTSVTAMDEGTLLDGLSLRTIASPIVLNGSLGKPQNGFPLGLGPNFFAPAHMATDANGDVYGLVYIYDPAPGYRMWRVRSGTRQREVFPDIPAHAMFGGKTMAYAHQAVSFTENYVIFPEIPCGMCQKGALDFDAIAAGWLPEGELVIHVLDKATLAPVAAYSAPAFFTWHAINAWENATHISFDFSWQPNATAALGPFTTGLVPWEWQGKLARATMPNPAAPGAAKSGALSLRFLTPFPVVMSPEFGVVNPVYMWREPCRYIWSAASTDRAADRPLTYWPEIIRVDTAAADGAVLRYRKDGWAVASPTFVPRSDGQPADASEGVLIVLLLNAAGENQVALLDAGTLAEVATLHLPVAPMIPGLHNHFDRYPASA